MEALPCSGKLQKEKIISRSSAVEYPVGYQVTDIHTHDSVYLESEHKTTLCQGKRV